ncbi:MULTISPECIES: hypothetical protein [Vibrio]|uniref:hypothetical protein n=1 Tax=Vibrio TaxID=662 RepID=UPI000CE5034D|nr:hypothetical protein [Vibrio hyugaensis]
MNTLDIVAITKDIIVSICALGSLGLAIYGVNNWLREMKGKTNFEAAKTLMISTYRFRDSVADARRIIIDYSNLKDMQPSDTEKEWIALFDRRWQPVATALQEFSAQSIEAEVLFGSEVKDLLEQIKLIGLHLKQGMLSTIEYHTNPTVDLIEFYAKNPEVLQQLRDTVVAHPNNKDAFSQDINRTVKELERLLKNHLKNS